ncbi:MAG: N5-glutamine methyltransferase family protein [Acidimicrobiales bacterium]
MGHVEDEPIGDHRDDVVRRLQRAGFVAAEGEVAELSAAAAHDPSALDDLVARRLTGEPLAWITGTTTFCHHPVIVHPGVYVPRPQSEALARRAADLLPPDGLAVDVCTGSGALAVALVRARPSARVVATDVDRAAVACARANGIDGRLGDLLDPVPRELRGRVDVIVGVVPYVPTPALPLLQRDTFAFETPLAYDGGDDGADLLRRVAVEGRTVLRAGGALLLELGAEQVDLVAAELVGLGYVGVVAVVDDDGDRRGIEATLSHDLDG